MVTLKNLAEAVKVMEAPTREQLEFELLNAKINAESPYNDGWTQQGFREKIVRLENKLKSIGKQTEINFE